MTCSDTSKMPRTRIGRTACLTVAALAAALSVCTGTTAHAQVTDENLAASMAAAKTPAEHEALATFFTKKAEAALADAQAHDRMGAPYAKKSPVIYSHCRDLAAADRKQAADYTAMAKAEQKLAKAAGKAGAGSMKGM